MSVAADRYHKTSGAVPYSGMMMMLSGSVAGGIGVSLLYSLLSWNFHVDKLIFIVVFVLAGSVGAIVRFSAKMGAVRNPIFCAIIGFVAGCATVYAAWVWFIWVASGYQAFITQPAEIWSIIQNMAAMGIWQREGGAAVGATELYAWWIGEALLVIGCATGVAAIPLPPYCEDCANWMKTTGEGIPLRTTDGNELRSNLESESYSVLSYLMMKPGETIEAPGEIFNAEVIECEECDYTLLNIKRVTFTEKKGEVTTTMKPLFSRLIIPRELGSGLGTQLVDAGVTGEDESEPVDSVGAETANDESV